MPTPLPRLVVAGTRSGVGKTTLTVGLLAALVERGHVVSAHKVGPDFLDPGYHALATGRPPRNLDTVLHGAERIAPLLLHGAAGADFAVIEGVMGLFDGAGAGETGSTAEVARILDAPVLLTVDAAASSGSLAAEVHGFATFDPRVAVAGVILNNLGSPRHEQLARTVVTDAGFDVVGAVHDDPRLTAPERHLGLVPVLERAAAAREALARSRAVARAHLDLDAIERIASTAPPVEGSPWDPAREARSVPASPTRTRPRIAVAGGRAFGFTYTEHTELLTAAGAEVVSVDPLGDEELPAGTDALVLAGGFPETHAPELAANQGFTSAVRRLASAGNPIVAECGGMLYLLRELDGTPMAGVIDAVGRFTDELVIGYRRAVSVVDSVLGPSGTSTVGHVFHRTTVTPPSGARAAWRMSRSPTGPSDPEGFVLGGVHASYLHAAWVSNPALAVALTHHAARSAS